MSNDDLDPGVRAEAITRLHSFAWVWQDHPAIVTFTQSLIDLLGGGDEDAVTVLVRDLKPGMVTASTGEEIVAAAPVAKGVRVTLESGFECTYIPELEFRVKAGSVQ